MLKVEVSNFVFCVTSEVVIWLVRVQNQFLRQVGLNDGTIWKTGSWSKTKHKNFNIK